MEYSIFEKSVSLIGCGNLGRAIIAGLGNAEGVVNLEKITIFDRNSFKIENCVDNAGDKIKVAADIKSAVEMSDILIIAVKPKSFFSLLEEVSPYLRKGQILVSLAAGIEQAAIKNCLKQEVHVVRAMPNVAAMVRESISLIYGEDVESVEIVSELFSLVGETIIFDQESEINVAGVLGACVPAIAAQIIEGLTDGGVKMGLNWDRAMLIAAQATLGAASMVVDLCVHTSEIKNMVSSPGGTTVESLHVLEKAAIKAALISAVEVATEKAFKLGKEKK